MKAEQIAIATANTQYGRLLREKTGLQPFDEAGVDVLLLQEVIGFGSTTLEDYLTIANYSLVYADYDSGLAIATRQNTEFSLYAEAGKTEVIEPIGMLGRVAIRHELPFAQRLRSRAVIFAQLRTPNDGYFEVGTTHPIVFTRFLARKRQLQSLAREANLRATRGEAFILGADMNHYPSPRKADEKMMTETRMQRVPLHEPTWRIRGSKHEWIARIGSAVTGRSLDSFDAQLDSMLYRGSNLALIGTEVIDIQSDHRSIIGRFALST